jgi:predicted HD phosphohydrolase
MPTIPFIGQDAGHHDLHHEKFLNNYALSFTWLDALGGYLVPGRVPGQQASKHTKAAPAAAAAAAAAEAPARAGAIAVVDDGTPMENNAAGDARTASFTQLKDCTAGDVELLAEKYNEENAKNLVNRVLGMLTDQDLPELMLGAKINLYEHGLQTATRALYDGASEDYVVGALLHDIGEMHCPSNHGEVPVSILRPFLEPEVSWVLEQHEVFQMYYYAHKTGPEADRHRRDVFKGHQYYRACVDFCEKWDQAAFDPEYESLPLAHFKPMVERVLAREPFWWDKQHPKRGACGVVALEEQGEKVMA